MDPLSISLYRPENLLKQTSNLRLHVPSSSLSEAFHPNNLERPSPESLTVAEDVAFYSAAKLQVILPVTAIVWSLIASAAIRS